jgi:hypothetical protein
VGMLGEGEGASDSILVLTEEWKMVEGQLNDSARGRGGDGVGEAQE